MKETIVNLTKSFVGESQARNRYTFYAKIAQKEGYEQIAEIFTMTADNEKVHAKRFFEHIQELKKKFDIKGDEIEVSASAPNVYGTTTENLKASIMGEHHEHAELYPMFAKIADKEKLPAIAKRWRAISVAEKHHEERYNIFLEQIKNKTVFRKIQEIEWVCRECGYVHYGKTPPEKCQSCDHPKAFYQVKCEEY